MEIITCQYCNTEVSLVEVEKEGGACPECGAMISGSLLFDTPEEKDGDFDEEEDSYEFDDSEELGDDDDDDDDNY